MVQIVGFDAARHEGSHQGFERFDVIVDAVEQHALAQHWNAGIDQLCNGRTRRSGELACMVGMQRDVGCQTA